MREKHDIIIKRASDDDMAAVNQLITEVFGSEQRIPESLIPVPKDLEPIWWCAKAGGIAGFLWRSGYPHRDPQR